MSEGDANAPVKPLFTTARNNPGNEYLELVREGISKAAKKWNLQLDESMDFTEFEYQGKDSHLAPTKC